MIQGTAVEPVTGAVAARVPPAAAEEADGEWCLRLETEVIEVAVRFYGMEHADQCFRTAFGAAVTPGCAARR